MEKIISLKNITKSYGSAKAVADLSFDVGKGEFFGFIGPNGAGKTTTIRMLAGIIKPDSGSVGIAGPAYEWKNILGIMPESRGFYEWMTAEEYLVFFAALYKIPANECSAKIKEILEKVGLSNVGKKKIGGYSRGMKQRLALARTLVNDPQILVLDEPTLGLDPQGQIDIQNYLRELNQAGVTILYSSHLLHEVAKLCTRIAVISQGRLMAIGTLAELKEQTGTESLTEIFLKLTSAKND